jgi:hypothetical protein
MYKEVKGLKLTNIDKRNKRSIFQKHWNPRCKSYPHVKIYIQGSRITPALTTYPYDWQITNENVAGLAYTPFCQSNDRIYKKKLKKTPWSESASELYRPSDRHLSEKWLPTFVDRGCHVVSVTDPYCRILGFSRQEPLLFCQVAPQLYSRGWVDPVPDPLLFL